ncbi:MAG: hypothetical protein CO095_02325 [Armatimonadetes bacterium CG_4_9_14_3_um_filter_58_7]|nr:MAG: hypothetical protein CO095_02325 [Armatimonadetes bacterium CG_4_9_14_3_um_filter_58_7]
MPRRVNAPGARALRNCPATTFVLIPQDYQPPPGFLVFGPGAAPQTRTQEMDSLSMLPCPWTLGILTQKLDGVLRQRNP